jgi:hypothetical protein
VSIPKDVALLDVRQDDVDAAIVGMQNDTSCRRDEQNLDQVLVGDLTNQRIERPGRVGVPARPQVEGPGVVVFQDWRLRRRTADGPRTIVASWMTTPVAFIDDMAEHGLSIESPWDLVNTRRSCRAAVPALVEWLERAEDAVPAVERMKFREALVRSLAVTQARGIAAPALLREFHRPGASADYRWAVGNSLEVVADDAVFADVADLARDRSYGADRQMVVLALARMTDPRAVDVLVELLDDDLVAAQAVTALGRLKASRARAAIERCLEHPRPLVRKEAKKALDKIGDS